MVYIRIKRVIDIIASFFLLAIFLPLITIFSICIMIESKGSPIFRQNRLGKNAKTFSILKLRSMKLNSEEKGVYEKANDSRVTKVGKFIRKTSIDELPQLINILKGEMSFIGPRPTLIYHPWTIDKYSKEQLRRFEVLPGVTGLAQINGRKELEWTKRMELDIEYINNLSFSFDCKILLKTIKQVILMRNNINTFETAQKIIKI